MSIDTRTEAEKRYDATRLGPLTTDEKRAIARQCDQARAAHFQPQEEITGEARYTRMDDAEALVGRVYGPGLSPAELIELAERVDATILKDRTPTQARKIPIAQLSNGVVISGQLNSDGTPGCAHLETEDGSFFCDATGHLAGVWAGIDFEIPAAALPKLRALFTSNMLVKLQEIAVDWEGEEDASPPRDGDSPIHYRLIARLFEAFNQSYTNGSSAVLSAMGSVIDSELDIVDFEALPALLEMRAQRELPPDIPMSEEEEVLARLVLSQYNPWLDIFRELGR